LRILTSKILLYVSEGVLYRPTALVEAGYVSSGGIEIGGKEEIVRLSASRVADDDQQDLLMGTEPIPEDRAGVHKAFFCATADIDDATFPSL
jgi:hypothetical protein